MENSKDFNTPCKRLDTQIITLDEKLNNFQSELDNFFIKNNPPVKEVKILIAKPIITLMQKIKGITNS